MRRTLLFWNRIVGGGNANSYACLRLFLHASTKVSCVGFIIWFPSGGCVVCFSFDQPTVANNSRLSYACILLFPTGTKYPAGSPYFRSQWQSTSYGKKPLQKRLKCLCGIQNKPNKHYTVLKLIIFIHTLLNSGHLTISPYKYPAIVMR